MLLCLLAPVFLCGLSLLLYLVFPPAQLDILLIGVDSRPGEGWLARADSIMLVGINPSQLRLSLLSIPRDLSLDVPEYGMERINAVHLLGEMEEGGGGPRLLLSGIERNFAISLERYVRLDFNAFVTLIDSVGGITIDVERVIEDYAFPTPDGGVMTVRFESGLQHMDGERALIYARTRHADDDYQRAGRQQQVAAALLGRLANPSHWPAALTMLRTLDMNISLWDLMVAAPPVILNRGQFEHYVIDREVITAATSGEAIPDYVQIAPWLRGRFD